MRIESPQGISCPRWRADCPRWRGRGHDEEGGAELEDRPAAGCGAIGSPTRACKIPWGLKFAFTDAPSSRPNVEGRVRPPCSRPSPPTHRLWPPSTTPSSSTFAPIPSASLTTLAPPASLRLASREGTEKPSPATSSPTTSVTSFMIMATLPRPTAKAPHVSPTPLGPNGFTAKPESLSAPTSNTPNSPEPLHLYDDGNIYILDLATPVKSGLRPGKLFQ